MNQQAERRPGNWRAQGIGLTLGAFGLFWPHGHWGRENGGDYA